MNKKLLILTISLAGSLGMSSLQANWQDWVPSRETAIIFGYSAAAATVVAAIWATIEHKYKKDLAEGKTIQLIKRPIPISIQETNEKSYSERIFCYLWSKLKIWSKLKKLVG